MRDILISRKRWKTVRVGGVGARQLGGGRRARFSSAPKRGGTSEEGAEGGRDEGRGGGELHRQINTRYFNGWEMRVCFAACLPGTAKLNFNSENGVQPSIRMETEPRIAYFIIVIIYIYIYTVSNIEEGERNKNYREKLFFLGAFLAEERKKKRKKRRERREKIVHLERNLRVFETRKGGNSEGSFSNHCSKGQRHRGWDGRRGRGTGSRS